ncbi:nudix hydrolase 9 isoform X3 [Cucumis melo]|uniref:Nudix hydrolase 9 isoform X3 n=1 Tax=Cucumis melo TaxID=3656 RepID=A0ABM3KCA8_CUCME|nr:nudix hydrolase 9 isoform X3 [Cucumis melo]
MSREKNQKRKIVTKRKGKGIGAGTMEKAVDVSCSPFKILIASPSGLTPSQVSIAFSDKYDRIPHPDSSLEDSITEIWNQRLQTNSSLFNGKKFRYGGFTFLSEGGSSNEDPHVRLHLGLTDYRTFVGTNLSPLWERFLVPSEDDSISCQHSSSPLGNGAIVETSDGKIVLLKRSNNVGEFPGHFVFPGGHPEPQELGIESHDDAKGFADPNTIDEKLSQEMFNSIIREVVEEIGVPPESLCNPVFIGVSRRELNVRPAAFFFMKCSLDSLEIQKLYTSAQDGYESTQLYTVPLERPRVFEGLKLKIRIKPRGNAVLGSS